MTRIGLVSLPQPGHINASMRLYRELVELGHEVNYITLPPHLSLFQARNLSVVTASEEREAGSQPAAYTVSGFTPEVVLIDSVQPHAMLKAWYQGVTVFKLSTVFPLDYDPELPPLHTSLTPSSDPTQRARIAAAWEAEHQRHCRPRASGVSRSEDIRALAKAVGFPLERVDDRAALDVSLRIPELVLAPRELDFERAASPERFYTGPCVDLARRESAFDTARLRADQPIVYCALGTQGARYPRLREYVTLVVEAARSLPEVQLVLASDVELSVALPPNVLQVSEAPQLTLLRRASAMISHAGLNSIKEALSLSVPLLVLPIDQDQPGNAARLAHHGVARAADWNGLTAAALGGLVREVLSDESLARRVRALGERLALQHERREAAAAFLRCFEQHRRVRS